VFFVALMRSPALVELTRLIPTRWDDHLRLFLATLAENTTLWNIAWEMAHRRDIQGNEPARRRTLRERIWARIRGTAGQEFVTELQVEGTCELVSGIGVLEGIFSQERVYVE